MQIHRTLYLTFLLIIIILGLISFPYMSEKNLLITIGVLSIISFIAKTLYIITVVTY